MGLMLMLTPSTEPTATLSLDPAASPLPGPLLSATATRAPSMEPAPTLTERGVPMLTLTTATATDSVLVLLPTPVSPPPSLPGLPRVSMESSATTTARGALMPMPSTATALESTTTTSTPATTATTMPLVCPDTPSPL